MKNLGTKIETIAKPIAKGFDYWLGTNIGGCAGCNKMKDNLDGGMSLADAFYDRFFKKPITTKKEN